MTRIAEIRPKNHGGDVSAKDIAWDRLSRQSV